MLVVSVLLLLLLLLLELLMAAVLVTAAVAAAPALVAAAAAAAAGVGRWERLEDRGYTVHSVRKIIMIWHNGDKFDNQKGRSYIKIEVCSVTQVV